MKISLIIVNYNKTIEYYNLKLKVKFFSARWTQKINMIVKRIPSILRSESKTGSTESKLTVVRFKTQKHGNSLNYKAILMYNF